MMIIRVVAAAVIAVAAWLTPAVWLAPAGAQQQISVRDALATLNLTPESPANYRCALFGSWADADGNGCNTRAKVLIRQSVKPTTRLGRCTISTGEWMSLYDGVTSTQARAFEIDHVVAVAEAWRSGANSWSPERRRDFYNDLNEGALIAVSQRSNRQKSDSDPSDWLPAQNGCTYLVYYVSTKYRWGLSVDPAEKQSLEQGLNACPAAAVVGTN
jgi:hypothetical protein